MRIPSIFAAALSAALALGSASTALADSRVALVIGNGAYASPMMPQLPNPAHDADAIGATLKDLGFDVEIVTDATKQTMEDALARVARKARAADVILFFYAGHGLQDQGKNYLAPIDATISDETDLRRRFVRLDDVLDDLGEAKGARILLLDACRDNGAVEALRAAVPKSRSAGMSRGLARIPEATGQLIAFATQPDRIAADGDGADSPFTTALIAHLGEPGIELRTALTRVRVDVARATNREQIPEVSDSLLGEIYLRPAALEPIGPATSSGSRWPAPITLLGHTDAVMAVAFSPDGNRILTGSVDKTAKLWDAASGRLLATLAGHSNGVYSVAFSPDGGRVLTGSEDKTAKLWDAASGRLVATLGHSEFIYSATFSPDGKWALTASDDGHAKLWDAASGRLVATMEGGTALAPWSVFSPNGSRFVLTNGYTTADLYDTSGRLLAALEGHIQQVEAAAFSPDGRLIATASVDKTAKLWDATSGHLLKTLKGHTDAVRSVRFSPDGSRVVTGSDDATAKIWDTTSGHLLITLDETAQVRFAGFSPDGKRVLTSNADAKAKLWDATTGRFLVRLDDPDNKVYAAAFSPDGKHIVTGSDFSTAKLWEVDAAIAEATGQQGN